MINQGKIMNMDIIKEVILQGEYEKRRLERNNL